MRRPNLLMSVVATLSLLVGGLLATPPASAETRHGWEFVDIAGFLPMTWTDSCPFVVTLTVPRQDTYQKVLVRPDGAVILLLTGALRLTFTNPANGKSVTLNSTGRGKAFIHDDGSLSIIETGHFGFITLTAAEAARFGLPPLALIAGVLDEETDPNGTFTDVTLVSGTIQNDVCATLA
jgi:hypothetical protein